MARILVIDDDNQVRTLMAELLQKEGHDVIDANNGEEGLHLFRKNPTELVITDIVMPQKEGIEVIRELLRDYPEIKIIAVTGYESSYLKIAKALGVKYTFRKPFNNRKFIQTVNLIINKDKNVAS